MLPLIILMSAVADAVPGQFTHQGRLLDADGAPLEGEVTLTFRVMNADTDGDLLWEEALSVPLNNGFYSAVLGADEDDNPLDIDVFSQAPVWLELQVEGEAAMAPRSPIHAVPYATMAGIAEELSGGPVDASEIAVDGVPVVNDAGEWVGPAPRVAWTDIIDIPPDFADGVDDDSDTDSFASLGMSCVDGDVPIWDGILGAWGCGEDTVLTADEVDAIVADNGYAMADDAFSRSFFDLLDVPADLLDGDDDTRLTEPEVDAMVEDNGYATTDELFSGSYADLSDRPDLFSGRFADLTEVPAGLSDGDDDTQLTEDQVDEMVADNGYLTSADLVGVGGTGTVIYTRCAWTGATMPTTGSCTPPACPSVWDDLGVTGNVKTGLAAHASTDYSPSYSESSGYQERACYLANPRTVLTTRCAWTGAIARDIESCTPPECPTDWTDLGITGNIKSAVGMYGSTDYSSSYSEASGYQERTCVR